MTNKLFPISLMTFLAIYLFVFPHIIKPSERIKSKQMHMMNTMNEIKERQEGNNAGLQDIISQNLKAESNSFIDDWHYVILEIIKDAIKSLDEKESIHQVEAVLRSTNLFIQNLPFSSYFRDYNHIRKIDVPNVCSKSTVYLAKCFIELELLKIQAHYFQEILQLSEKQIEPLASKILIKGQFDKSSYQVGNSVSLDLKFLNISSFQNLSDYRITINGLAVDLKHRHEDHWVVDDDTHRIDSMTIESKYSNPVTGTIYEKKFILNP